MGSSGRLRCCSERINNVVCPLLPEPNRKPGPIQLALERLIQQPNSVNRRRELVLFKRYASDPDFKRAFDASVSRLLTSAASVAILA